MKSIQVDVSYVPGENTRMKFGLGDTLRIPKRDIVECGYVTFINVFDSPDEPQPMAPPLDGEAIKEFIAGTQIFLFEQMRAAQDEVKRAMAQRGSITFTQPMYKHQVAAHRKLAVGAFRDRVLIKLVKEYQERFSCAEIQHLINLVRSQEAED